METKIARRRFIVRLLILGCLACAAFAVWSLEYALVVVSGPSMEPTYTDGQKLIITRIGSGDVLPEGYPVCVLYDPDNNLVIKRLIGYPGDTVALDDGSTTVNGSELRPAGEPSWDTIEFEVPTGYCLFLGDNRLHSIDARAWDGTYTPVDHIIGYIPGSELEVT